MSLTDKQKVFVEEYLTCWNATEAARRAGYQGNDVTLASIGCENLTKPYMRQEIDKRITELRVVDKSQVPEKRIKRNACFVYLIQAENGLVKIGKTVDIHQRFGVLCIASPEELKLVAYIKTDFADELEERLHSEFNGKRVRGEWFSLSSEDIETIIHGYGFNE